MSKLYGLFIDLSNTPQSLNPQGLQPHFQNQKLSLNNKYKEKHPKNPHFCPLFRCLFLIFHPSQFVMIFSNARFRVSHSRNKNRVVALLGFSRLGFLWELVIREERFWNFYCGVVTRRHSFGFSRNNMKGALYHWRNQWVRNQKKGKFLIFRFWRCQVLGMKSLTCRFLNEIEKRLSAPSNF